MAKTTEQILAAAKAAGVEVTVTQAPKGTGEISPLPGIRQSNADARAEDLLRDDSGDGTVE